MRRPTRSAITIAALALAVAAASTQAEAKFDCQTFKFGSNDNNVAFNNSDEVSSWKTTRGC